MEGSPDTPSARRIIKQVEREVNLDFWDHFELFSLEETCTIIHDYFRVLAEPLDKEPQ